MWCVAFAVTSLLALPHLPFLMSLLLVPRFDENLVDRDVAGCRDGVNNGICDVLGVEKLVAVETLTHRGTNCYTHLISGLLVGVLGWGEGGEEHSDECCVSLFRFVSSYNKIPSPHLHDKFRPPNIPRLNSGDLDPRPYNLPACTFGKDLDEGLGGAVDGEGGKDTTTGVGGDRYDVTLTPTGWGGGGGSEKGENDETSDGEASEERSDEQEGYKLCSIMKKA